MSVILCVWEFGSNLGHLNQLKLPITIALKQGHTVYLAAKELHRVREVLGDLPIKYLQSPYKLGSTAIDEPTFLSYTHLLKYQILGSRGNLEGIICGWRTLFELVNPDLVLYESSPIALIASKGLPFKKITIGNGFAIPPKPKLNTDAFAVFLDTPKTFETYEKLKKTDSEVLTTINSVLSGLGLITLNSLAEIYSQVDDLFLMTLPILDQFGARDSSYLGIAKPSKYASPLWPSDTGKKVFIYLNVIPSLERLLYCLKLSNINTLVYIKDCPLELKLRYSSPLVKFLDTLVDLSEVAEQVDWAITHGNHSTTMSLVLGGIPQLLLPQQQEHYYLALRLKEVGCAEIAYVDQPTYVNEISRLTIDKGMRIKAKALQASLPTYEDLNAVGYIETSLNRLLSASNCI